VEMNCSWHSTSLASQATRTDQELEGERETLKWYVRGKPVEDTKDVNESRNARVSKKILVLENLISRRARNSRTHKAKLHD